MGTGQISIAVRDNSRFNLNNTPIWTINGTDSLTSKNIWFSLEVSSVKSQKVCPAAGKIMKNINFFQQSYIMQ